MAVKQVKDRGASVLARLKKQAKESGINYQTCLQLFVQEEFLRTLWRNYNPGLGLAKPEFSSVLKQIDRFFGPIFEAIKNEDEFFGMWSPEENVWK